MHDLGGFQRDDPVASGGRDGPEGLGVERDGDEGEAKGGDEWARERIWSN
ncbi:hypothetical protein [Halorientalis sp. IM1011]|nr:hypothetical protein [Halorientalis sp. IM1011]